MRPRSHKALEGRLAPIRVMGDAVISGFFAADKPRARDRKRAEVESWLSGSLKGQSERLDVAASSLRHGDHPISPFHWEIEFPEVFARENGGFDAIVGNPPFAGKNTIISGNAKNYQPWLMLHEGAHGNADLVTHFFRRAFGLLRGDGVFGLIATNTIGQGDTRASGLTTMLSHGCRILRATRRLKWPGEAAVIVSVVHLVKGEAPSPILDGRQVRRISAYLVEGDLDTSPVPLAANSGKAYQGSIILGMGFTFDDTAAAKGVASSLDDMQRLIERDPKNTERIFPYLGGEEVNNDPRQSYHRYVIDFADFPRERASTPKTWSGMTERERDVCRRSGVVPMDYIDAVAADWPDLLDIVARLVQPARALDGRDSRRKNWWRFAERAKGLYTSLSGLQYLIGISCDASPHHAMARLPTGQVYAKTLAAFCFSNFSPFASLQSRVHEAWARFFSSTLEDRLRYTPSDCFRTFPFPENFEAHATLEARGEAYHTFRAQLMIDRNEGLTKTYNRFHAIEQDADEGKTPKTRLDWPAEFKDKVLAHLLALNAERAAAERAAGLTPVPEADEEDIDEEAVA
jgi:hypothetical protein